MLPLWRFLVGCVFLVATAAGVWGCHRPQAPTAVAAGADGPSLGLAPKGAEDVLPATLAVHLEIGAERRILTLPATWDTATVTLTHTTALLQPLVTTLYKGTTLVPNGSGGYVATTAIGTALRPASGYTLTVDLWNGGTSGVLVAEKQQAVALVGGTNAITVTLALVPGLALSAYTPASGPAGAPVTLSGQGFSASALTDKVDLGGVAATVTSASATSLGVKVPDVAPGVYPWDVKVGSQSASKSGFNVPGTIGPIQNWITLSSHQTNPAIAYGTGEYLATWTDTQGGGTHIYGALITPAGPMTGSYLPINTQAGSNQDDSAVAYDPGTNQFMVCFWDSTSGGNVYGQLVNADGTLSGGRFAIATANSTQTRPQVCFDAPGNQFLVTWMDKRNGNPDIYGQRFAPDATPLGTNFPIYKGTGTQDNPSVCYSSSANIFLVAWNDDTGPGTNIKGQLVNPDGSMAGSAFTINTPSGSTNLTPDVGFDSTTNNFFVVWADSADPRPIRGQFVGPTGTLVGAGIVLTGATNVARTAPRLAYEPWHNKFVVVWNANDSGTNWDIDGQFVNDDGTLWGNNFPVVVTNGTQTNSDVAADPAAQTSMAAYQDGSNGNNVYGQELR